MESEEFQGTGNHGVFLNLSLRDSEEQTLIKAINLWTFRRVPGTKARLQEKALLTADKGLLGWVNFQTQNQQLSQSDGCQHWLYIFIHGMFLTNTNTGGPSQTNQIRIGGRGVQVIPCLKALEFF